MLSNVTFITRAQVILLVFFLSPVLMAKQLDTMLSNDSAIIKGTTRCASDLSLALPMTGRIANIKIKEGSSVNPGDELLHLEQIVESLDVKRRRFQWKSMAELDAAKARRDIAKKQADMARKIYANSRGISLEDLQNRELAQVVTVSEFEKIKTQKKLEKYDYLIAKENLSRRTLRAPVKGIVTHLIKHKGESAQANEEVVKLCDLSTIQFVANLPGKLARLLSTGQIVELTVGFDAKPVKGKIFFLSPVVDSASGLREIKINLIEPGVDISPGVPASLDLTREANG